MVLELIQKYQKSWTLLKRFDEGTLQKPKGKKVKFAISYEEAKEAIAIFKNKLIKQSGATDIFGIERDESLQGILQHIYQTFDKIELLPTVEEKAANLLYYIVKDHPFVDGNKRIGALLFILFLQKNDCLDEVSLNANVLVALTLMIASSVPKDKEMMIRLIINIIHKGF